MMDINTRISKDIGKTRERLIAKAKKKGLWENFGQKELRKLKDKHIGANCVTRETYKLFQDFDNWCMNFDLSDLNSIRLTRIEHGEYHKMKGVV